MQRLGCWGDRPGHCRELSTGVAAQTQGSGREGRSGSCNRAASLKETLLGPILGSRLKKVDLWPQSFGPWRTPEGPSPSHPPLSPQPSTYLAALVHVFPGAGPPPSPGAHPRLSPLSPPAPAQQVLAGPGEAGEGAPSRSCRGPLGIQLLAPESPTLHPESPIAWKCLTRQVAGML